jgi:hypothetical protein
MLYLRSSYRTIIELFGAAATAKGLAIRGEEDTNYQEAGTKVSDADLAIFPPMRHEF